MNAHDLESAAAYIWRTAESGSLRSADHGKRHAHDVARIALMLATDECDYRLLYLFAALHDSQRQSEFDDPRHGQRAAALMRHMWAIELLDIHQDSMKLLHEMLMEHDRGRTDLRPTVATAWDADRLTLLRVGTMPTDEYMSLDAVRVNLPGYIRQALGIMRSDDKSWAEIAAMYEDRINDCKARTA
jgi:hypothetical protein